MYIVGGNMFTVRKDGKSRGTILQNVFVVEPGCLLILPWWLQLETLPLKYF